MRSININKIKDLHDIKIIDVRERSEYADHSLPNTINIPTSEFIETFEQYLNKDETYYIMCLSGKRSLQVADYLDSLGYKVINLEGGLCSYFD